MEAPFIGGMLAFLGGTVISAINFAVNLLVLRWKPSALPSMSVVRQVLSIGYLAAVFFLSQVLPWEHVPLLLGAALGLTIPAFLFSFLLARINDRQKARQSQATEGDELDG